MIDEREFQIKSERIKRLNESKRRRDALNAQKEYMPKVKFPPTSKIVLWAVIFICVDLIAFVKKIVMLTGDVTALNALIGILPTLLSVVIGYLVKSTRENTAGGIVFETAIKNLNSDSSDEAVG